MIMAMAAAFCFCYHHIHCHCFLVLVLVLDIPLQSIINARAVTSYFSRSANLELMVCAAKNRKPCPVNVKIKKGLLYMFYFGPNLSISMNCGETRILRVVFVSF